MACLRRAHDRAVAGRPVELVAGGAQAFGPGLGPARGGFRASAAEAASRFQSRRPLRGLRGAGLSGAAGRCGGAAVAGLAQGSGPVAAEPGVHGAAGVGAGGPQSQRERPVAHDGAFQPGRPAADGPAWCLHGAVLTLPRLSRSSPKSILAESLEGVDRQLLYPAIRSVLENEDSAARGSLQPIYGKLTDRDLVALLPAILKAIRDLAPSNEMFGDGIRLAGLDLVSRLHLREGMPLCVSVIEPKRWGSDRRLPKCMECLARYGVHAKAVLPQLREIRRIPQRQRQERATCLTRPSPGSKPARLHPRWWTSRISRPVPEGEP